MLSPIIIDRHSVIGDRLVFSKKANQKFKSELDSYIYNLARCFSLFIYLHLLLFNIVSFAKLSVRTLGSGALRSCSGF